MKIDILTIFPEAFSYFDYSIPKIAQQKKLVEIKIHDLRKWANNKHNRVDDKPFGGGAGMVLKLEPIYRAIKELKTKESKVILTSAQGVLWDQKKALQYSKSYSHLIFICGHYEGVDYRVSEHLVDEEVSIGRYVLSGGELASMVVVDSIVRLIPGVLGNPDSLEYESFSEKLIKEYPQYTRPATFTSDQGEKWSVPDVLLSGDHKKIEDWRQKNSQTSPH